MIRYDLKCENDHCFDSWFANSAAFDSLVKASQVACPHCGSTQITKSLMAPGVAPKGALSEPTGDLAKMRDTLEKNSENVGLRFASLARAMHEGDEPARQIHGEAKPDEARALIEDGVPVLPLPFVPKSQSN